MNEKSIYWRIKVKSKDINKLNNHLINFPSSAFAKSTLLNLNYSKPENPCLFQRQIRNPFFHNLVYLEDLTINLFRATTVRATRAIVLLFLIILCRRWVHTPSLQTDLESSWWKTIPPKPGYPLTSLLNIILIPRSIGQNQAWKLSLCFPTFSRASSA